MRRDRHARRAAPPDPHVDRAPSWPRRPTALRRPAGRARPGRSRATGSGSRSTPRGLDAALDTLQAAGVRSLTSQPPTLEELFLRHYGDQIEEPTSRSRSRMTGTWPAAAHLPAPGPVDAASGGPSASRSSTGARRSASTGLYTTQAEFDAGRREHGEQRRVHRDGRPGPGARHHRRPGHLAVDRVRRDRAPA